MIGSFIAERGMVVLMWIATLGALAPDRRPEAVLQPGVLYARVGKVTLIKDVLVARYKLGHLQSVPGSVEGVLNRISGAVDRLNNFSPDPSHVLKEQFRMNCVGRLNTLMELLASSTANYSLHPHHIRSRRGLINVLGEASKFLFGTATDNDVKDLRSHYDQVIRSVTASRKVIEVQSKQIVSLQSHLVKLNDYMGKVSAYISGLQNAQGVMINLLLIDQAIDNVERTVAAVKKSNDLLIGALLTAAAGAVNPSLLPMVDLQYILSEGHRLFRATPLFTGDLMHLYYPIIGSTLTFDSIAVYIPLQSNDHFQLFQLEPFPFTPNNSAVYSLQLPEPITLVADDLSLYATTSEEEISSCISSYSGWYHCLANQFAYRPYAADVCEISIVRESAVSVLSACTFRREVSERLYHRHFHGFHYFYFPSETTINILCSTLDRTIQVEGHYQVRDSCQITSLNFSTIQSNFHVVFSSNLSRPEIRPLTMSLNITLPMKMSIMPEAPIYVPLNASEVLDSVALRDFLPYSSSPTVLYPSILVPLLLFCTIVLFLLCRVYKFYYRFHPIRSLHPSVSRPIDSACVESSV